MTWLDLNADLGEGMTTTLVPRELDCELPAHDESMPLAFVSTKPIGRDLEAQFSEARRVVGPPTLDAQAQMAPKRVESPALPEVPAQQIEQPVRVQAQVGADAQEWIIRPWRLQANTGLSFRSSGASNPMGVGDTPLVPANLRHGTQPGRTTAGADPREAGGLPARWRTALRLPIQLEASHGRIAADEVNGADPVETRSGQLAALMHWSQRMLRWSGGNAGAGVTAWVRDYALMAGELPVLLEALVAMATEQGISLARIVVNGHEAWSAGAQHMTRDDHDGR